jgi:hypothetical protein
VQLAGCLDDAITDADLDEGLEHFQYLLSDGIVTQDQWHAEMLEVIDAVMEWGERQERLSLKQPSAGAYDEPPHCHDR